MATYIYRSAKTGKIVTEKYAKANPDSVVKEKVKEPRQPKVAPVEAPVVVEAPVEAPAFGFFRVYGHIIEATPKGNIKHWRAGSVHSTEPTDMTVEEGEPMTREEIYEELH